MSVFSNILNLILEGIAKIEDAIKRNEDLVGIITVL